MNNKLQQHLGHIFHQFQQHMTQDQCTAMVNAMAAIQHTADMVCELEKSDHIINNCINAMTDIQRYNVALKNGQQGISDAWAYRTDLRKQSIAKAKRLLGE
ncbi:hypothetical protein ACPC5Q_04550 [Acinetobacter junii]|uniref:hypothetical protein n=1 Tax=Acinetobacter junii TaxID=40215 RepID=UPI003C240B9B